MKQIRSIRYNILLIEYFVCFTFWMKKPSTICMCPISAVEARLTSNQEAASSILAWDVAFFYSFGAIWSQILDKIIIFLWYFATAFFKSIVCFKNNSYQAYSLYKYYCLHKKTQSKQFLSKLLGQFSSFTRIFREIIHHAIWISVWII